MSTYRYDEQRTPPPAQQVTDVAISRYKHAYEVEPSLMTQHVSQQTFPNWDTLRIVRSRQDHLNWMHRHWACDVVSGDELLAELAAENVARPPEGGPERYPTTSVDGITE